MKKIISILVAMLMLLSSVSVFAAIEVTTTSALAYYNTLEGVADAKGTITDNGSPAETAGSNISFSKYNPANFEFKNEQVIVTRIPEKTNNALTYIYFSTDSTKPIEDDVYAVGFDFKFSGITSNTASDGAVSKINPGRESLVWTDSVQASLDKGTWFVDSKGNAYAHALNEDGTKKYNEDGTPVPSGNAQGKTVWCFKSSGDDLSFITKKDGEGLKLASNNQPAIYFGSAELLQDTFYTLKICVNNNTRKYYAEIIDESGNIIETGVDGTIQKAFADTAAVKVETYLYSKLNSEASVTYDNIFFDKNDFAISAPDSFQPNEDGTVSFSAEIPDNMVNPALYINDTFIENITVVPDATVYNITAPIPEGTMLGDVKFEIRGTLDGAAVSSTATAEYCREFERPISISWNKEPVTVDGETYYDAKETRGEVGPQADGLYRIDFKFKPKSETANINTRLVSNVVGDKAITTGFDKDAGNYMTWEIRKGALANANVSTTEWNTASLLVDYRGGAINNNRPYYFTVNGVTRVGEMWLSDQATLNGFYQFAINATYFKDVTINELVKIKTDVVATYGGGNTAAYEGAALISPGMENLSFVFTAAPDSASDFSFVDESGIAVANTTISVSDKNVVITPAAGVVIPSGNYKLVADKTATFEGNVLGAGLEVPVALYAPASIFAPADGEMVGTILGATTGDDSTEITFFAPDANKVEVYVNDIKVKTFDTPSEDGLYSFAYTPEKVGKNYIDVYSFTADGVELASSSFVWSPYKSFNEKKATAGIQNVTESVSTNADGGKTKLYTATTRGESPFVNLDTLEGHRIGVREFDMKVGENTWVYTELGTMTAPGAGTGSGSTYPNVTNIAGTSGYAVFDKNNKICGTDYTWEAGQWYHIKHIIDMENMTASIYVTHEDIGTDVKVLETPITNKYLVENKETAINYNKYRFILKDISTDEGTPAASLEIANPHTYELKTVPVASVLEETIIEGTDSVDVILDKAYDDLDTDFVSVKANGEYVDGAMATVSEDGKTITVSGLAGIKAGTRVEISVMGGSMFAGTVTDDDVVATLFVANERNLCVLPIKVANEDGTAFAAYSKYINGSGDALDSYFITTEFDTSNRLKQTNFTPVTINAGETGIVYCYGEVTNAQNCKVMLWNSDLSQLAKVATFAE